MSSPSMPSTPTSSSSVSSGTPPPGTPPNLHQNSIDPDAQWLVQKYGGTSVGKFAARIAENIVPEYLDQHKLAIVCSARSGSTKALGTTNLLLRAASEALRRGQPSAPFSVPGSPSGTPSHSGFLRNSSPPLAPLANGNGQGEHPAFSATVDIIRSEHLAAARAVVKNKAILADLETDIERDCDGLRGFLYATQVIDEISPRSKDSIIGFGEKLACKIVAAALQDRGIDAEYVSLENVVPEHDDPDASIDGALSQAFYDAVSDAFAERVRRCGARVPVVTGFFSPVPGSLLRQVGRGYTDLAAALLAAGLGASELQIWKEVDGIFTADPRKVATARVIPVISPEEAAELTYYGSEVVHPFTMEQVIRRRIPIRIKNVENPAGSGTVIHPDPDVDEPLTPVEAAEPHSPEALEQELRRRKVPTAVTIKEHIVVLNVQSNRKSVSHGFLAGIFGTLDRFGVVVDLISTSEVYVSMAIEDVLDRKRLSRIVRELEKIGTVSVHHHMAILSLVGKQMRHLVGIAGRMFSTLAQGNINIEMISQGANEINISCVIDERDAIKALNLIHQSCLQIKPEVPHGRAVGPWLF
ncbi:aspartate kinase [Auriscalpium vulgare]|uniref:Aspartate kinase n=1 Tax=Auriscalpium vulgare TaxID=40419 RepID=A0ACB8RKK4_9AGAM|nr:aspartate kinase [Auriscalpium vulgare]